MSTVYLRQWTMANARSTNHTPDLFASCQFKIFGIRRSLTKLGADPAIDLETLGAHELEQLRIELAAQLSSRNPRDQRRIEK
jgi:hypothetical protein